ncbi:hypothetical protein BTO18_06060 [Polaribacter porphyrae]|uniref:Uncharacterized protein n=1 Tax=Polaribacter porphyrae TaxID=1137780 RepID=A0A2S7WMD9_9FLAO|nr:hypothetical protein BTO18_06060 [Polaribacter porphyrae]
MFELFILLLIIVFFVFLYWNYKLQTEKEKNDLSGNLDKKREDYERSSLFLIDYFKNLFKK